MLAAAGAVMLPASLFLDWYELRGTYPDGADIDRIGIDGWASFEITDLILVLIALATLAMLLGLRRSRRLKWLPSGLGAAATILVGFELVERPPEIQFYSDLAVSGFDSGLETGAWLALGGAILILAGGLLQTLERTRDPRSEASGAIPPPD
jgi:hypothetical protein